MANRLDTLLEIIADTITSAKKDTQAAGLNLWPIPTPQGEVFWGDEWSKLLNNVLHQIDEAQVKNKLFPSRIAHILWRTDAIKNSNLIKEEKGYTVRKLFDILSVLRKDIFCQDGKNIVWDLERLEKEKQDGVFSKIDGRDYFNMRADLYSYCELLYWANPPVGYCFHGPYFTSGDQIVVREYYNLKPEVWEFTKRLKFSKVKIFECYNKNAEIKIDFFERQIQASSQPISFAVFADDKYVPNISDLSTQIQLAMSEGTKYLNSLNRQQLIEKHADYWFYALKPLCDLADKHWHPPQTVKDNIYKRYDELNKKWETEVKPKFARTASLSLSEQKEILKEMFDPRT